MSYSPPPLATENVIVSTGSGLANEISELSGVVPASAVWPAANMGIFVPLYLQADIMAQQIYWNNGATVTASTWMECAVYNEPGTQKLISSGVVTHAGVSIPQAVTIPGGVWVPRGRYWIGMVIGNGTSTLLRWTNTAAVTNMQKMLGTTEMACGTTQLPSTVSFGVASFAFIPDMGLRQTALAI